MALVRCAECGAQISDKAVQCPRCGAPIDFATASRKWGCGTILLLVAGAALFIFVFLVYIFLPGGHEKNVPEETSSEVATTPTEPSSAPAETPAQPESSANSVLQASWKFANKNGVISLKGEVKNISSEPIRHVIVVGLFAQPDGKTREEPYVLKPEPMQPGQTSTFDITFKGDPQIQRYEIKFRDGLGKEIGTAVK